MCAEEIIPNTWGDLVGTDFLEKTSWRILDNGETEESEVDPEVYNRIMDSLNYIFRSIPTHFRIDTFQFQTES